MILFAEHHYQDKSVWDVIQIYLHQLLRTQDMLAKARRGPPFDYKALNASNLKDISETLDILNKDLERMKLATSIQKLRAVRKFVNKLIEKPPKGEMSVKFQATLLGIAMDELNATVEYDLIASLTYYFSVKEREWYSGKRVKSSAQKYGRSSLKLTTT